MTGRRLTRMGYRMAQVDSAAAAFDMVHMRRFDLMILGSVMPQMSSVAMLGELRAASATGDLPVIMITARSDPGAAIEALQAGADDVVIRPFDFDVLGARIERLLARGRALNQLRRANAALDARIAHRAIELSELRAQLEMAEAEQRALEPAYGAPGATVDQG